IHEGHGPRESPPAKPQGGGEGASAEQAPEGLRGLSRRQPDGDPVDFVCSVDLSVLQAIAQMTVKHPAEDPAASRLLGEHVAGNGVLMKRQGQHLCRWATLTRRQVERDRARGHGDSSGVWYYRSGGTLLRNPHWPCPYVVPCRRARLLGLPHDRDNLRQRGDFPGRLLPLAFLLHGQAYVPEHLLETQARGAYML